MYVPYWNLVERPFQNAPERRFAYLSEQHKEGLARLVYLVQTRKLGGVIAGPYDSGKSMILELLDQELRDKTEARLMRMDAAPGDALVLARHIVRRLGHDAPVADAAEALQVIEDMCSEEKAEFGHLALAIDESQLIREAGPIEFLHLLTNIRVRKRDGSYGSNAITLILCGHEDGLLHR